MYGANNDKIIEYTELFSKHTLDDKIYEITQNEKLSTKKLEA